MHRYFFAPKPFLGEPSVGSEPNTTYISYYVIADPRATDPDISPISLVRTLNTNRDQIEKFIPNLNPGNLLLIQNLKTDEPFWALRPSGTKSNFTWIEFNVKTSTCGTLYVIFLQIIILGGRAKNCWYKMVGCHREHLVLL